MLYSVGQGVPHSERRLLVRCGGAESFTGSAALHPESPERPNPDYIRSAGGGAAALEEMEGRESADPALRRVEGNPQGYRGSMQDFRNGRVESV